MGGRGLVRGPVRGTLYVFNGESRAKGQHFLRGPGVLSSPCSSGLAIFSFYQMLRSFSSQPLDNVGVPSQRTLSMGRPGPLQPDKSLPAGIKGCSRSPAQKETKSPSPLILNALIAQWLIGKLSASPRKPVRRPWHHTTPVILSGSQSTVCQLRSNCSWSTLVPFLQTLCTEEKKTTLSHSSTGQTQGTELLPTGGTANTILALHSQVLGLLIESAPPPRETCKLLDSGLNNL